MDIDIKNLKGGKFINIGRYDYICRMIFEKDGERYHLHVQCAWRISQNNVVIMTDMDVFSTPERSRFDGKLEDIRAKIGTGREVKDVQISDYYDITFFLDNGMRIDIFVDDQEDECWRFVQTGVLPHQVVQANSMEFDC